MKLKSNKKIAPAPIAIVYSRFNQPVIERLLSGAMARLEYYGFTDKDIIQVEVPGAVEIPLAAKFLAKKNTYKAIITLGAVIKGETPHFDYVCNQVSDGCQKIMLEFMLPVVFGVITTNNAVQAYDRAGGMHGHKGKEAVDTAIEMIDIMQQMEGLV